MSVMSNCDQNKNYYQILGVSPQQADAISLKKAYKNLSKKYHPDKKPSSANDETFKEISRAYRILSDPVLKHDYDLKLIDATDGGMGASFSDRERNQAMNEFVAAFKELNQALRRNRQKVEKAAARASGKSSDEIFEDPVDESNNLFCYHYSQSIFNFRKMWEGAGRRLRQSGWCGECVTKAGMRRDRNINCA